uniref:histone H1.10 n=1 Tax=Pristiophorus japonicus TaxID=55135 RepID=UPI00398E477E
MSTEVESLPVAPAEEEEEEEEEQQEQKSPVKKAASKKKKSGKGKNQPGRYSSLLVEIVERLGARNGSSLATIYKEAKLEPWFDMLQGRTYLRYSLQALVTNGTLIQVTGRGANGSFKMAKRTDGGGSSTRKKRSAPTPRSSSSSSSGSSSRAKKSSKKSGGGKKAESSRKSPKSRSGTPSKSKKGKSKSKRV